jgi:hypothetical protein
MNLNKYQLFTSDFIDYEFYSEGPKGSIKKIVTFTKAQDNPIIYNLAFGDADLNTGFINDEIITDNKDTLKVLATVASTIYSFCDKFGNHFIYARGSTPARTRLYQMEILKQLDEIRLYFNLYGVNDGIAYPFQKNINYDGFLIKRK